MKLKFLGIAFLCASIFSSVCSMSSEGEKLPGTLESLKEWFNCSYLFDNFKQVTDGQLYRSGTLSPERLKHYIKVHGLKTVINLRNRQPDADWWKSLKNTCIRNRVNFIDIETSCYGPVKEATFKKLIEIFKDENAPFLIMDKGGVVRTGEIAALWILVKWDPQDIQLLLENAIVQAFNTRTQTALEQLSVWKGYLFDCCYGKRRSIKKTGDCLAKEIASRVVAKLDLRDPFKSRKFLANLLEVIYPEKSIKK